MSEVIHGEEREAREIHMAHIRKRQVDSKEKSLERGWRMHRGEMLWRVNKQERQWERVGCCHEALL